MHETTLYERCFFSAHKWLYTVAIEDVKNRSSEWRLSSRKNRCRGGLRGEECPALASNKGSHKVGSCLVSADPIDQVNIEDNFISCVFTHYFNLCIFHYVSVLISRCVLAAVHFIRGFIHSKNTRQTSQTSRTNKRG